MRHYSEIIEAPLITEKGTLINEEANQVLFRVAIDANKVEIQQAVEEFFQVKVAKVRTVRVLGKKRRVGPVIGQRAAWKKAYVTLADGHSIDFFEGA